MGRNEPGACHVKFMPCFQLCGGDIHLAPGGKGGGEQEK